MSRDREPEIRYRAPLVYEIVFMMCIAFIIVFGSAGLYNAVLKEIAITCQEGC